MPDIKFGLSQYRKPTPTKVNQLVKVYMATAGAFLAWMQTAPFIGPKTQGAISSIIGLTLLLVPAIAPLWGVDVDSKTVPTDQVTAMDTDQKPKP